MIVCVLLGVALAGGTYGLQETGSWVWQARVGDPLYIHKEALVERVLQGNHKKLITAPRGFGKSTNLEMLQSYFSVAKHVNSSADSPRQGTYAVLFINMFAHEVVATQQKTYELLREKIHLCYLTHDYLVTSERLNSRERDICERWSSMRFVEITNHSITMGLTHLTQFLNKHWGRPVLLLVDEYDSIILNALHSATIAEFRLIRQLVNGQISKLVKYNQFVGRAVIAGESFIMGSQLAADTGLMMFRFLGDHDMVDYFGFTRDEIDRFLTKFSPNKDEVEVKSWYGGYTNKKGLEIFNPFSVNKYISENRATIKSYCRQKGQVNFITRYLHITFVRESILKLLRSECAPVTIVEDVSGDDIVLLKEFLASVPESLSHQHVHDLFFTHLLDQGYLAFSTNDTACLAIPNTEVEQELSAALGQYYTDGNGLNPHRLTACAKLISNLQFLHTPSENDDARLKDLLKTLFHTLGAMFKEHVNSGWAITSKKELSEIIFAVAVSAPGFVTKTKLKAQFLDVDNHVKTGEVDFYLHKGPFGIIIELSHAKSKSPNSKGSLQKILDRKYYSLFTNKIYSPQAINSFVFIGISTNNKGILSISGLLNSHNISEAVTERKLQRPAVARNYSKKAKTQKLKKNLKNLTATPLYNNNSTEQPETAS